MRLPLLVILLCLGATGAMAQQVRDLGTSRGGLVRDASTLLAAGDAATRAGVDCEITAADQRGRGEAGERLYEIACRDAPGWMIISGSEPRAYGCLMLAEQPRLGSLGCRLRANRNPRLHYARMAADAGLPCQVNDGAFIGRSAGGAPLYEIGCRNAAGAWLEQSRTGWVVTDCLDVRARGDNCRFTTPAEEALTLSRWLSGSPAGDCQPTRVRSMGRNAAGDHYVQLSCTRGEDRVVSLDADRRVISAMACTEAVHLSRPCVAG